MKYISKTWIPSLIYFIIPLIFLLNIRNVVKDFKIEKLYYQKYLFSHQQDLNMNRNFVIIAIILSIFAGILYLNYLIKNNYPFYIKILGLIFVLLYIFEFSFPYTKYSLTHFYMVIFLIIFSQIYFFIMMLFKKKKIKYTGIFIIFLTVIIALILLNNDSKISKINEKNKIKLSKLEYKLITVLLILISIIIYLIGL